MRRMDTSDRTLRLLADALVAGSGRSVADIICSTVPRVLPVDGAALTLAVSPGNHHVLSTSDAEARRLEELQLTLGEGPALEALRTETAVLVEDLSIALEPRWPVFAEAVGEHPSTFVAVLAVPLSTPGGPLGVLDLYRRTAGDVDGALVEDAHVIAHAVALLLVDAHLTDADGPGLQMWSGEDALIHQATGMLVAQLGVNPQDALARLRGYAFAQSQTVQQIARAVLDRSLRLEKG